MDRSFSATRAYGLKMEKFLQTTFACVFILSIVQVNGYSKYGRTCKDIGCLSTERCVMVPECDTTENKCGYPTCEKNTNIKQTCETKTCGGGQHCEYVNARPTCINDASATGYDSAGVSIVNGHRTHNNDNINNHASVPTNTNPYANANAPPIDYTGRNHPVSSGTNYGYPADPSPSNNNNNNGHSGSYSPPSGSPSSSGTNLGYPPYPTQNRMPMPGQTGVYQQPPPPAAGGFYPGNSASGYPPYPTNQQYPSHSNYPYQTRNYNSNAHYPRFRNTSSRTMRSKVYHVFLAGLALTIATLHLS